MPVTVELKKLKILLKEQELILQKKSYEIAKLQLDLANKTSVHDAQEIILLKDKVKSLTKINSELKEKVSTLKSLSNPKAIKDRDKEIISLIEVKQKLEGKLQLLIAKSISTGEAQKNDHDFVKNLYSKIASLIDEAVVESSPQPYVIEYVGRFSKAIEKSKSIQPLQDLLIELITEFNDVAMDRRSSKKKK
jgi:hypothetical protein